MEQTCTDDCRNCLNTDTVILYAVDRYHSINASSKLLYPVQIYNKFLLEKRKGNPRLYWQFYADHDKLTKAE